MENFPNEILIEILIEIFIFLRIENLINLKLTCKKFQKILNEKFWKVKVKNEAFELYSYKKNQILGLAFIKKFQNILQKILLL